MWQSQHMPIPAVKNIGGGGCRKVANREAARRMRQRRTEQLGSLSTTCDGLKHENNTLQQQCNMLIIQNRDLQTENAQLKEELLAIKHAVVRPSRFCLFPFCCTEWSLRTHSLPVCPIVRLPVVLTRGGGG